jgi:phosphoribosylamine--glycine ligase
MRLLIVGNGGRESALLWKLHRDAPGAELFVTLGNGGTAPLATAIPLAPEEPEPLAAWAAEARIDLTVVGPEVPLAAGIADRFAAAGLPVFGPTRAAAEIESSKAFAKRLMREHGIPTAAYESFTDPAAAEEHVRRRGGPLVVKASGLAAGKGAIGCSTTDEAIAAARELMGGSLGEAGREVVVEERMEGEEISVFALSDGERVVPLLPAQDHKRAGEGDTGPNTGGMGAYAPVSIATPEVMRRVMDEVLVPTVGAMRDEGRPFQGLLYAGLMLTADGPKVVEFNCRFGDPETQVVLPMMESSLLAPMLAVADGSGLGPWVEDGLSWRPGAAVTTVVAAEGYPGAYRKGIEVIVPPELEADPDVLLFHAGTRLEDGRVVTSGGRVLAVTGLGPDVAAAAVRSRDAAGRVRFDGARFRRDIGWREIERSRPAP